MCKTWSLLNTLISKTNYKDSISSLKVNGILSSDPLVITNTLNDFFVNIGDSLASRINPVPTSFESYLKLNHINSLALTPTDPDEIIKIINELPNKTSSGHDDIPLSILKSSIHCISKPLSMIINNSMSYGIFPDPLKIAKICPIFKSNDKTDVSNYRPISLLTSFSKIFEKVIYTRLASYLEYNGILDNAQYGFRKNHSTYMPLLDLYDKITNASENKEYAIGIFVDLSKAFDTINHTILVNKLSRYGIRGVALDLVTSYLSNRKQFVTFKGINSSMRTITCGVPQGSVLGPLLFLIFINDIVNSSRLLHFILFADDTNLFYSCKSLELLLTTVNDELSNLAVWFRANKLSLNISKTNYIIFGSKHLPSADLIVKIDEVLLTQVDCTKFLGVLVDAKTTWKSHIALIAKKISRGLGAIKRVKRLLPANIILLLYHTMITPYLTYCCIVWGCASPTNLQKLRVLQKRAIRIISNAPYRNPSTPLFKKLELLRLDDLITLQTALFIYKSKLGLLPKSCSNYLIIANRERLHNTRVFSYFVIPKCRTVLRKNCISVRGPTLWNTLPPNLQAASTITEFKRSMITFLFAKYT